MKIRRNNERKEGAVKVKPGPGRDPREEHDVEGILSELSYRTSQRSPSHTYTGWFKGPGAETVAGLTNQDDLRSCSFIFIIDIPGMPTEYLSCIYYSGDAPSEAVGIKYQWSDTPP